jgi:DNA-binding HxlR family transcriptional regulator
MLNSMILRRSKYSDEPQIEGPRVELSLTDLVRDARNSVESIR